MSTTDEPDRPAATRRSYTPFIVLGVILVVGVAIALIASSGDDDTAGVTVRGEPLDPIPDGGRDQAVGAPAPTPEGLGEFVSQVG